MLLEAVIPMAVAMGRVLVLPPAQKNEPAGENVTTTRHFFPVHAISKEHLEGAGLEFRQNSSYKIQSKLKENPIPQDGRKNWDGDTSAVKQTISP